MLRVDWNSLKSDAPAICSLVSDKHDGNVVGDVDVTIISLKRKRALIVQRNLVCSGKNRTS
jgi:hypothetical protein